MPRWDPIRDLMQLQDRMNELFEDATQRRERQNKEATDDLERADWIPSADIYEQTEEYVVSIATRSRSRSRANVYCFRVFG